MDRAARLTLIAASLALAPLAGCATLPADHSGLRIEQRPAEGIVRISNSGPHGATLYYNVARNFGDYQMLFVRFRDGASRVLRDNEFDHGWWTPLAIISQLSDPNHPPERNELTIPVGGQIDIPRDLEALTRGMIVTDSVSGPCQIQIMLVGYRGRRWGQRRIEVLSEWQPVRCPTPNVRHP